MQQQDKTSGGRPTWRTVLDVAAAAAMTAAAVVLVWVALKGQQPNGPQPAALPDRPMALLGAPTKGASTARVALVVFSDFECPYCGVFARDTLPELERLYVDTGRVRIAFRHFPIVDIHPRAMRAAQAAECAEAQGRFWQMHDQLFRQDASLDDASLFEQATVTALNRPAFERCMASVVPSRLEADLALGRQLRIRGTPAVLIGRIERDGYVTVLKMLGGFRTVRDFKVVLDNLLVTALDR